MIFNEENSREHIKEIQRLLYEISIYNSKIPMMIPDGIYNSETQEAVRIFQQEYGIPATGNTDHDTWEKLIEINRHYYPDILSPNVFRSDTLLIPGSSGAAVYFAQLMLNTIGGKYHNIPAVELTGIYDAPTENSISAFRKVTDSTDNSPGINAVLWNSIVSEFNKTALV